MLTVSDVQALIVITLGDAFVLNRRVRQQRSLQGPRQVAPGSTPTPLGPIADLFPAWSLSS